MQPFKLGASYRLEKDILVWDSHASKWIRRKLDNPRLVADPQEPLTEEQAKYLKEYTALMAEAIRIDKQIADGDEFWKKKDPEDYFYFHYKLLSDHGFSDIEETPDVKQITDHVWERLDSYEKEKISWEEYKDEVERWFLFMAQKIDTSRGPDWARS